MSSTVETPPAYISLASSTGYVENTPNGTFLLGVSAAMVPPATHAALRLREVWQAFTTHELAANELLKRAEWSIELHGRKPATRASCLAGLDAILGSEAPLLDVRDTRAKIADMRDRLALVVERDKSAALPEVRHVDGDHNWQRVSELETAMAKFMQTCDQLSQSHTSLKQAIEGLHHKLNAR